MRKHSVLSKLRVAPFARRPRLRTWFVRGLLAAAVVIAVGLAADRLLRSSVTLDVSGKTYHLHTHAGTVGDVLHEAGILVDPEDVIQPVPQAHVTNGMTITVKKARAVALLADDSVRQIRTQATNPLDVLAEQGILVGPYDVVLVDGQPYSREQLAITTWAQPAMSIRLVRSAAITIIDGEHTLLLHATQSDVAGALDAAGLTLYLADPITPDLSASVMDGMTVHILRSVPITVSADGQRLKTRAVGPTVGDALAEIGLAPIGQDYTLPTLDILLEPDMAIQVVRVTEGLVTKEEPIEYDTIYQRDPSLPPGTERVIQAGVDGLRRWQIRVRYEDGREVGRDVVHEWIARPPTSRVIAYGGPSR